MLQGGSPWWVPSQGIDANGLSSAFKIPSVAVSSSGSSTSAGFVLAANEAWDCALSSVKSKEQNEEAKSTDVYQCCKALVDMVPLITSQHDAAQFIATLFDIFTKLSTNESQPLADAAGTRVLQTILDVVDEAEGSASSNTASLYITSAARIPSTVHLRSSAYTSLLERLLSELAQAGTGPHATRLVGDVTVALEIWVEFIVPPTSDSSGPSTVTDGLHRMAAAIRTLALAFAGPLSDLSREAKTKFSNTVLKSIKATLARVVEAQSASFALATSLIDVLVQLMRLDLTLNGLPDTFSVNGRYGMAHPLRKYLTRLMLLQPTSPAKTLGGAYKDSIARFATEVASTTDISEHKDGGAIVNLLWSSPVAAWCAIFETAANAPSATTTAASLAPKSTASTSIATVPSPTSLNHLYRVSDRHNDGPRQKAWYDGSATQGDITAVSSSQRLVRCAALLEHYVRQHAEGKALIEGESSAKQAFLLFMASSMDAALACLGRHTSVSATIYSQLATLEGRLQDGEGAAVLLRAFMGTKSDGTTNTAEHAFLKEAVDAVEAAVVLRGELSYLSFFLPPLVALGVVKGSVHGTLLPHLYTVAAASAGAPTPTAILSADDADGAGRAAAMSDLSGLDPQLAAALSAILESPSTPYYLQLGGPSRGGASVASTQQADALLFIRTNIDSLIRCAAEGAVFLSKSKQRQVNLESVSPAIVDTAAEVLLSLLALIAAPGLGISHPEVPTGAISQLKLFLLKELEAAIEAKCLAEKHSSFLFWGQLAQCEWAILSTPSTESPAPSLHRQLSTTTTPLPTSLMNRAMTVPVPFVANPIAFVELYATTSIDVIPLGDWKSAVQALNASKGKDAPSEMVLATKTHWAEVEGPQAARVSRHLQRWGAAVASSEGSVSTPPDLAADVWRTIKVTYGRRSLSGVTAVDNLFKALLIKATLNVHEAHGAAAILEGLLRFSGFEAMGSEKAEEPKEDDAAKDAEETVEQTDIPKVEEEKEQAKPAAAPAVVKPPTPPAQQNTIPIHVHICRRLMVSLLSPALGMLSYGTPMEVEAIGTFLSQTIVKVLVPWCNQKCEAAPSAPEVAMCPKDKIFPMLPACGSDTSDEVLEKVIKEATIAFELSLKPPTNSSAASCGVATAPLIKSTMRRPLGILRRYRLMISVAEDQAIKAEGPLAAAARQSKAISLPFPAGKNEPFAEFKDILPAGPRLAQMKNSPQVAASSNKGLIPTNSSTPATANAALAKATPAVASTAAPARLGAGDASKRFDDKGKGQVDQRKRSRSRSYSSRSRSSDRGRNARYRDDRGRDDRRDINSRYDRRDGRDDRKTETTASKGTMDRREDKKDSKSTLSKDTKKEETKTGHSNHDESKKASAAHSSLTRRDEKEKKVEPRDKKTDADKDRKAHDSDKKKETDGKSDKRTDDRRKDDRRTNDQSVSSRGAHASGSKRDRTPESRDRDRGGRTPPRDRRDDRDRDRRRR